MWAETRPWGRDPSNLITKPQCVPPPFVLGSGQQATRCVGKRPIMPANTSKSPTAEIALLLRNFDDAYSGNAWHGPTLRAAVRGVPLKQALWRPAKERHCIAEIALHCAYWKYAARRRLRGDKRGSFPLKGSNWFALPPKMSEADWKGYVKLLDEEHGLLRAAIAEMTSKRLGEVPKGAKITHEKLIYGIAAHDVYHAGQVRLLKSLQK